MIFLISSWYPLLVCQSRPGEELKTFSLVCSRKSCFFKKLFLIYSHNSVSMKAFYQGFSFVLEVEFEDTLRKKSLGPCLHILSNPFFAYCLSILESRPHSHQQNLSSHYFFSLLCIFSYTCVVRETIIVAFKLTSNLLLRTPCSLL